MRCTGSVKLNQRQITTELKRFSWRVGTRVIEIMKVDTAGSFRRSPFWRGTCLNKNRRAVHATKYSNMLARPTIYPLSVLSYTLRKAVAPAAFTQRNPPKYLRGHYVPARRLRRVQAL